MDDEDDILNDSRNDNSYLDCETVNNISVSQNKENKENRPIRKTPSMEEMESMSAPDPLSYLLFFIVSILLKN